MYRLGIVPFRRLSLSRKILRITMLTTATALGVMLFLFALVGVYKFQDDLQRELALLSRVIGSQSTAALLYEDGQVAQENLEALFLHDFVQHACMYDASGEVFAQAGDLLDCPVVDQPGLYMRDWLHIYIYQPILFHGEVLGSIYILSTLYGFYANIALSILYAFCAMLLGLLVAYRLSSRLRKTISTPVKGLVEVAKAVSEHHNYAVRAHKTSEDELGVLVESFNHMLQQIHDRESQVREANTNLEARVEERTEALRAAKRSAEKANKAKSDFLANMSHELRTPMHAILSYADFGVEETGHVAEKELKKYFARIHESGLRLLALLNNLLDLSKLEAGKHQFSFSAYSLLPLVQSELDELYPLFEEKRLKTKLVDETTEHSMVMCDKESALQVINNLLSNAIKFSPEGGTITLRIYTCVLTAEGASHLTRPSIALSVTDEGEGVADDQLEQVFEQFMQAPQTSGNQEGTGLGLAICKEIMEAHRGKIWVEPQPDKQGACFVVAFPQALEIA